MTLPFNPLLTDRQFGPRANPVNPFDRRSGSVYTKPLAPVKITAKRPTWSDVKSGSVGRANTALGTRAIPNAIEVAEEIKAKARAAYAKGTTANGGTLTQELFKRAAQADLFMGGAFSAVSPALAAQTAAETSRQFGDIASLTGEQLSTKETAIPLIAGSLFGNTAAFMTGTRAVTGGVAALGRATGSAKLANIATTIERARDARNTEGSIRAALRARDLGALNDAAYGATRALVKRGAAELLPAVPINMAQGALDKEGGETSAMAADALGYKGLAASIRERKGRVAGAIENQAMDFVGFGVMESLSKAVRMKMVSGTELGSAAAGAAVGAYTDDENRLRGAGVGAIAGLAGARGGAVGLSTRAIGDARIPIIVNGMDVSVPAPFKAKSAGLEAIAKAPQEKGDAGYWAGVLAKGTRKAEVDDTRISEWLAQQTGTITKVQVANALRERLPVLGASDRGYVSGTVNLQAEAKRLNDRTNYESGRHQALLRTGTATEEEILASHRMFTEAYERSTAAADAYRANPEKVNRFEDRYSIPGEHTNASELVTTALPKPIRVGDKVPLGRGREPEVVTGVDQNGMDVVVRDPETGRERQTTAEWIRKDKGEEPYRHEAHWPGVANPIAHTRLDERVVNGERALVVQESQSDIHQTARKKDAEGRPGGYKTPESEKAYADWKAQSDDINRQIRRAGQEAEEAEIHAVDRDPDVLRVIEERKAMQEKLDAGAAPFAARMREHARRAGYDGIEESAVKNAARGEFYRTPEGRELGAEYARSLGRLEGAQNRAQRNVADDPEVAALWEQHTQLKRQQTELVMPKRGAVPDLPFKTTPQWTELNLKRALDEAVKRGVSRVILPLGRQAADMFSVRTVADRLDWVRNRGTPGELVVYRNGVEVDSRSMPDEELADHVGRELAARLLADGRVEGDGLDVGAQGMTGYYEGIVPKVIKDYAKKLGVKIDVEKVGGQNASSQSLQETYDRLALQREDAQRELRDAEYARTQIPASEWQRVNEANDRIRSARVAVTATALNSAEASEAMYRSRQEAAESLSDNLSFRMTPELKAAVEAGQPLYAMGAATLLGDERDDRTKLGTLAALAMGSISRRAVTPRAARAMRSALGTTLGVITQEAQSFGRFGHLGGFTAATPVQLRALNRDVQSALNPEGRDLIGEVVEQILGRPSRLADARETRGVWEGAFGPNRSLEIEGDDAAVRLRAAIHGLVEGQDAVAWHRFTGAKGEKGANSASNFGAILTGPDFAGLTDDQLSALFKMRDDARFTAMLQGATESGGHLLIRNFQGLATNDFKTRLREALRLAGVSADDHTGYFAGELLEGRGAFLRAVGRQPDALREIRGIVSRLEPVYAKHAGDIGADPATVAERMARLNVGLETLEGQLRAPKPVTNVGGVTVPRAMETLAGEIADRYKRIIGDKDTSAEAVSILEGRLRVEVEAMASDLGLTDQEIKDWYSGGARMLRDISTLSLPTLADDTHWTIFTAISSVMSAGQKVNDEIRSAMNVWAQFEENGIEGLSVLSLPVEASPAVPGVSGATKATPRDYRTAKSRGFTGVRGKGIGTELGGRETVALSQRTINHEAFLSDLRAVISRDGMEKTAEQLREGRLFVNKGKANERSYPVALDIIGPKTGQYFLDKLGLGGEGSTIDLWMARLYHALRGEVKTRNLTQVEIDDAKAKIKAIAAERKKLGKEERKTMSEAESDELDALKSIAAAKPGQTALDDTVTPAMRDVMQRVLRGIAKDFDAQPSSAQALAWYAIKRMVAKAGGREDANAYATLASAAAEATTKTRAADGKPNASISMGPRGGTPGWSVAKARSDFFGIKDSGTAGRLAVAAPLAFADDDTEDGHLWQISVAALAIGAGARWARRYLRPENLTGDAKLWVDARKKLGIMGVPLVAQHAAMYKQGRLLPTEMPRAQGVDVEFAKKIARWYESSTSKQNDPEVIAAYRAFAKETREQYDFLVKQGVRFEFGPDNPYESSAAMIRDVAENQRLRVYATQPGQGHPLLSDEENDLFRAVHDYFGHAKEGNQFGPKGEENAYRIHSAMFSEQARRVMATETRGQNSWVNFGPPAAENKAKPGSVYADQKPMLMPLELMGDYPKTPRTGALNPSVAGALAGAGTGAAVGSIAGAYADRAIGDDQSTREGALAGLLAGALAGTAGGAATLRRFPALLGGRTGATLASSSPAVAKVLRSIATGERDLAPPPSLFGSGVAQAASRLYAAIVDDVWALRKLGRDVSGDQPLGGLDAQLRQSSRWQTWGSQRVTAELKPVLKMAKGREGDVMVLLKARRDLQLRSQGAADKSEFTMQELLEAANDASVDSVTVAAADAVQDYYRRLLDWKLDEKLLTPEAHAAIVASEDYYTPFLREWDQEQMSGGNAGFASGGKVFNRGKGVRKMDREQQARAKTTDPFEIAVLDTFKTAQLVGKQRVMQMVSAMVEANGGEIPNVLKRVSRSDKPDPLGRRIEAIVNGELVTYEVLDPDVLKALSSFGPKTQVPSILRMVKEFKRATITSLPDFMVRNVLRDNAQVALGNPVSGRGIAGGAVGGAAVGAATAYGEEGDDVWAKVAYRAVAGAGIGAGGAVLLPQMWRTMRGVTDIMAASDSPLTAYVGRTTGGNSQVWNDFLTDGAASIGHYARDANDARRVIRTLRGDRSPAGAFINPKRWWQAMETMGSTLENAPRLATYKTSLQTNPGDRAMAAAKAADISLDFSRKGGNSFQQGLNETNAFFNARLQGWDKLGRMVRDPRTWAVGFAGLTAPSIGNWMVIHQDDESRESYYEHPSWVRNTFWLVPTGGGEFLYIPKPFELGTIFATIPERMLDWAYTKQKRGDARPGESAANTARELFSSTVAVEAPLTDFAKPLLEQGMNYDMFRNRPIVSSETYSSAKTLPEFQQDDETSKVARLLGERYGLSPQRIDHLVSAYGGSMGKIALRAGNSILPGEDVSRTAGRMPVVGDLVAGFTDRKGTTSDDEVTVRRRYERVQRVENALRPLMKVAEDENADPMKREAAGRAVSLLMERERKTVGQDGRDMDGLMAANDALSSLRDAAREAQRDRSLSQEDRTAQLNGLAKIRARIARAAAAGRYEEVAAIMAELGGG